MGAESYYIPLVDENLGITEQQQHYLTSSKQQQQNNDNEGNHNNNNIINYEIKKNKNK